MDFSAVAAVFGRVVKDVQEHLLHPLRVAADLGDVLVAGLILEVDALLPQAVAIHKDGILKYAPKVADFHIELKPAVLNPGELQQLLHQGGQALGLLQHGHNAPAGFHRIHFIAGHQGFAPAGNGGQRRSQLMGHRGQELRLHLLCLTDLQGEIVDGAGQFTDFVVILREFRLDLGAIAAGCDPLGRLGDLHHRGGNGVDEIHPGAPDQNHHKQSNEPNDPGPHKDLPVRQPERGHQSQRARHLPVRRHYRNGNRQNSFAGLGIFSLEGGQLLLIQCPGDIRRLRLTARGQAKGRADNLAAAA